MESILDSVKDKVGGGYVHDHFNEELIDHINSVFAELEQLGLRPNDPFQVHGSNDTWTDCVGTDKFLRNILPTLVGLKVRVIFDTPSGGVATEIEDQIARLEFRLQTHCDSNT